MRVIASSHNRNIHIWNIYFGAYGKTEDFRPMKIKRTIQDVYDEHTRNLHVALWLYRIKIFDAEAIKITLLILNFSDFNIYIFVQKNNIRIYKKKNISPEPMWFYFQI